jgi:acetate kinase
MREIELEAARGSERHRLAIEIYCYHVRKYIGAYMAALGGVDAVVFTGGIGENSRLVRRLVCEGMDAIGIALDPAKNEKNACDISTGKVKILVIPTNEELAIARDTRAILDAGAGRAACPPPESAEKAAGFKPDETAKLVLLWAQAPQAGAAALAAKLGPALGRTVAADAVSAELERLALVAPPGTPKKAASAVPAAPVSARAVKPAKTR